MAFPKGEIKPKLWPVPFFSNRPKVPLGVAGALLLLLVVIGLPKWQVPDGIATKDSAALENENRRTVLQGVGGLFFFVTAWLSFRNLQIAEGKQAMERLSEAAKLLSDSERTSIRGGIYTLERIAKDSPDARWSVVEILIAFVTERSPLQNNDGQRIYKPVDADIQAALAVIVQCMSKETSHTANLIRLDLNGACFEDVELKRINFQNCDLVRASFKRAKLADVFFWQSALLNANFTGAVFSNVSFVQSELTNTNFSSTDLTGALFLAPSLDRIRRNERTILPG